MLPDLKNSTADATARNAAILRRPLILPCGATLPNRLVKGAMSELLADGHNRATEAHQTLYRTFTQNGPGMLLTGNVQIDRDHLEHPANVVIQGPQDKQRLAALRAWSSAAKEGGAQIWMQLAYAGRQSAQSVNKRPKAPSAIPLVLPGIKFGMPVALTGDEILDLIQRFGYAASVARETGFDGVELHAAHGYIFSQFLSPRSNQRTDEWGGDLAGRARFLLEVIAEIRRKVGPSFPIGVKLNSADFQRGGFSFEESQIVGGWLDEASVDLIEISGGTWEQPKMANIDGLEPAFEPFVSKASAARESYFAQFAPEMRRHIKRAKLMVTGGFRTAKGMADAIEFGGVDLIGLSRPLCLNPDAPGALLAGKLTQIGYDESRLRIGPGLLGPKSSIKLMRAINGLGSMTWFNEQMILLGAGEKANPNLGFLSAFIRAQKREKRHARWMTQAK